MKPLPKSGHSYHSIAGVRLYRDDLEHILGILTTEKFSVRISDDRFIYESLQELQESAGNRPVKWVIEATTESNERSDSRLRIYSERSEMSGPVIVISGFGDHSLRIAPQIKDLLLSRQTTLTNLPLFPLFWLGSTGMPLFFLSRSSSSVRTISAIGILGMLIAIILYLYRSWLYPKTILNYRHESGFFSRNRNAILMNVISGLIGALISRISDIVSYLASRPLN